MSENRRYEKGTFGWLKEQHIVRGKPFWKRDSITITYTPEGLEPFKDHLIDIDWLNELLK